MRKLIKNKNKKGFAMAELLAVSIVLLFIFSILFSNYLPLVAEYETRLSYNDVTAQYAAHYVRKMYKEALDDVAEEGDTTLGDKLKATISLGIKDKGYYSVYSGGSSDIIFEQVYDKEDCERIIEQYGIEEIIITNYKLKDDADTDNKYVKDNEGYTKNAGDLYNYIHYLPNYEKSIYTGKTQNGEEEQLYRLILKTKDYGYATTPILSDYKTPGSCFEGVSNGDGKTLTITKYLYNENNGCGKEVIIKNNNVKLNNDVSGKITKIGKETFKDMPIEKVTLSDVDYIGDSAFENTDLLSMPMPSLNNIKFIGSRAFAKTQIDKVDLSGERIIGDYAFADNLNLGTVILPEASIYSKDDSGNLILAKGLFAGSGTDADGIDVTIPSNMKYVGEEMFYLAKIKGITLENGVETIGSRAFSQYNNDNKEGKGEVAVVEITANVESIGEDSFRGLGITNLTIVGTNNLSIGIAAFENNNIENLSIPSRVTTIGAKAFENSNIKTLTFSDVSQLDTIQNRAFFANKIENLEFPDSLKRIESYAFANNLNLNTLSLNNVSYIGQNAFAYAGIKELVIPSSVTSIATSAFSGGQLKKLEIYDGEKSLNISESAFLDNRSLNEIIISARVSSIKKYAFSGIAQDAEIKNFSEITESKDWCNIFDANNITCSGSMENKNKMKITYMDVSNNEIRRYIYMGGATNE